MLEIERRFTAFYGTGLTAYLALQRALMRHFVARGGTEAEFCERLAPVFRERHGRLLDDKRGSERATGHDTQAAPVRTRRPW